MHRSFALTRRACYVSSVSQAIAINYAPLLFLTFRDAFGVSLSQIALLIGLNFAIQLTVDALSAWFMDRIGLRQAMLVAHVSITAGLCGYAVFPFWFPSPYAGLLLATLFTGLGGGLVEVLVSPIIEACPKKNGAASMSFLHSFYCWGQAGVIALSVLFFALFGIERWRLLSCLLALVPLCGVFLFAGAPLCRLPGGVGFSHLRGLFGNRVFLLMLVMMIASGASEMIMAQWASSFAVAGVGVDKTTGDLLGPCLFALLMGAARLSYALLAHRVSLFGVIAGSSLLCAAAYLVAALSPLPLVALLGCGLCGLAVGVLWPGVCAAAARHVPGGGISMFSLLALAGDVGCLAGPSLAGRAADLAGGDLRLPFLLAAAVPALLFLCTLLLAAQVRKKNAPPTDTPTTG